MGPANVNTTSEQGCVLGIVMCGRHVTQPADPGSRAVSPCDGRTAWLRRPREQLHLWSLRMGWFQHLF